MSPRGGSSRIWRGRLLPHWDERARGRDYGNQERADKKIHLAVDLTAEKMIIHVLDEGIGFKLSDVPDPLAEENLLSTSGRGIFLMRAFMDEFDVLSGRTGGAEIVMSKKLPAPGSASSNGQGGNNATPQREA